MRDFVYPDFYYKFSRLFQFKSYFFEQQVSLNPIKAILAPTEESQSQSRDSASSNSQETEDNPIWLKYKKFPYLTFENK